LTSQADDILLPLPKAGQSHAVVFFNELPPSVMTSMTTALKQDYPNLQPLNPRRWGASSVPRPISFGEMLSDDPDGGWNRVTSWHVLIDSEGIAPEVKEAIKAGPQEPDERIHQKMEEAGASALVFLLRDGSDVSTPVSKLRALCRPVWRLLELGATGVAFPEGGTMLSAETLRLLPIEDLAAGHSYLFVSSGLAEKSHGKLWFRTHGMAQFGLPDLCHGVPEDLGDEMEEELTRTRLLMETLPPEMIAVGGVLPTGGEVQVGPRVFRCCKPPEKTPQIVSRFGFMFME
jgi:hypothetical protein